MSVADRSSAVLGEPAPSPNPGAIQRALGLLKLLAEAAFRALLAGIRERGWILTRGEKLPGAVGTSAPVFGAAGVIGSLTVTIPEVRFQPSMEPRIQRLVVESAARISAVLGYRAGHALCSLSISPRRP